MECSFGCFFVILVKIMKTKTNNQFEFSTSMIAYPILFVLAIWIVFWFEIRFGYDFNDYGILPRTIRGLRGIIFGPFIHANIKHLFNNTIPLFVLSLSLFYFYKNLSWKVLGWGLLVTGILTWGIGRPANHIGASGVIYMLTSFLFFKGILSKHYRLIALSLIVVFLYGGMLWFVVPIDPKISWEGHLSGLLTGLLFAFVFKKSIAAPRKYEWENKNYNADDDPFMRHFDENGNFVEDPDGLLEERSEKERSSDIYYRYYYIEDKLKDQEL